VAGSGQVLVLDMEDPLAVGAVTAIHTGDVAALQRDRLRGYFTAATPPEPGEVNAALWGACHGGQQPAAAYLLDHGADINWIPGWEKLTPLDAANRSDAVELADWLRGRAAVTAAELDQ
jgi:hypothetical protein